MLRILWFSLIIVLYALFHVPHECSQSKQWIVCVELVETLQERCDLLVFNHCEDGIVESWPCVASQVRVARLCAASAYVAQQSVAACVGGIKCFYDIFLQGTVVCYKYCFHCLGLLKLFFILMFFPVSIELALLFQLPALALHSYCTEDAEHTRHIDKGQHRGDYQTADD